MARRRGKHKQGKGPGEPERPPARPGPRSLPVVSRPAPEPDEEPAPDSPRGQAEALIDEAFERDDEAEVVELARRALERWPDAVDAHLLLSAHAPDAATALEYRRAAAEAAERVLAAADHPTEGTDLRAWVRARTELADALVAQGGEAALREARAQLEAVLFRAPAAPTEDGGGPRALLTACLLDLGDDAACEALLAAAPPRDAATTWAAWARVLLAVRRGARDEAEALAREALERSPHVRTFLLGRRRLPTDLAGVVVPGEPLEAALVVLAQGAAWRATPGALAWLQALPPAPEPAPKLAPKLRERARDLPQDPAETWQLGFRRMPRWVEHDGERTRPWLGLAVEVGPRRIVAAEMTLEPPSLAQLLDTLVAGIRRSREGPPRRPGRVEVRTEVERAALEAACAGLGIECAVAPLGAFDDVVETKARKMASEASDQPGAFATLPPARVASMSQAAADLYRAAPWETLGDDVVLRVDATALRPTPVHAVVLGAAGLAYGLVVAPELASLRAMREDMGGNAAADAVALLFEEASRLPLVDVDPLERHGSLAAEDAYPWLFGVDASGAARPTTLAEVDLIEALARALPAALGAEGLRPGEVGVDVDGHRVAVRLGVEETAGG